MDPLKERKRSVCYIKPKLIYVEFNGQIESIEISNQCSSEDVQDVLKCLCGAGRRDIIKLHNYQNVVLPLNTSSLESNSINEPYRIELISCCPQLYTTIISQGSRKSLQDLDNRIRNLESVVQKIVTNNNRSVHESTINQVNELESRVSRLQQHVKAQTPADEMTTTGQFMAKHLKYRHRDSSASSARCPKCPYYTNICPLRQSVHIVDLTNVDEISDDISPINPSIIPTITSTTAAATTNTTKQFYLFNTRKQSTGYKSENRPAICDWSKIVKTHKQIHSVWIQYQSLKMNELTRAVKESLKEPTFNMWGLTDAELMSLIRHMFISLDLTTKFSIPICVLDRWLLAIYQNYNCVPFHNFTHAFCVVQMMYSIINTIRLAEILSDLDILSLMFAALSHDLDHPGLNNTFQINAKTSLARRYNDQSPLENHHCAMAFHIIDDEPENNILQNLTEKQYKRLREITIKCILGTDMARHSEILTEFKSQINKLDISIDQTHRLNFMVVILKACDISNEARPGHVSEPWVECLLEEFFQQSDYEKKHGLPWAPFMDRDRATKSNSQVGFIKFVIMPLFEMLGNLFPIFKEKYVSIVHNQLDYYTRLQEKHSPSPTATSAPEPVSKLSVSIPSNSAPVTGSSSSSTAAGVIPKRRTSFGGITNYPASTNTTSGMAVIPCRKSSAGSMPTGAAGFLNVSSFNSNTIASTHRKTSTGSLPSRQSSNSSLVAAHS